MYGLNVERRILDNILYEVDSSDNYYNSQFITLFVNWYKTPSTDQAILPYSKQN
jgi:hypothetical protein